MQEQKSAFIKNEMFSLLSNLAADSKGSWGKMNGQQMVEHLADFFDISSAKVPSRLVIPEEHLPKYKAFLLSDKEFRENTKAPAEVLGEEPIPVRTANMEAAISTLRNSVDAFYKYYENTPVENTTHPVFGSLNFEEWILLHYKHVIHHLKQFGYTLS
ncbi:MAG: DUF1569 domain-containing protein [Ferruginibacter sp.]